jgi:hypothetical protein
MQLKYGFLSLLLIVPFAMGNPITGQSCSKDLQLQTLQSQAPIHVPDMDVVCISFAIALLALSLACGQG